MKRLFDILFSFTAIVVLSPLLLMLAIWVSVDSPGNFIYRQWRVGKNSKLFQIWKFRTMHLHAENIRSITISNRDNRITKAGLVLRKFKLDELPQLFNVLTGEMSLVGPRPELKKYVELYDAHQLKILHIKPGITDLASLVFSNENQLLATTTDPEAFYKSRILPLKIRLNKVYLLNHSTGHYFTFLYWSVLHLLHLPCKRLQRVEGICKKWLQNSWEPALSSSHTQVTIPA